MCGCLLSTPPTGDPVHNPGTYPDWESNRQPLASQASTQSTEPHQPGPSLGHFFSGQGQCLGLESMSWGNIPALVPLKPPPP